MNNSLTLYIPDTNAMQGLTTLYECKMARRFGGCTTTRGIGSWINGQAELEREPVTMITSYFGASDDHQDPQIGADVLASQFIRSLKKAGEEAVMIVRNGEAIIA